MLPGAAQAWVARRPRWAPFTSWPPPSASAARALRTWTMQMQMQSAYRAQLMHTDMIPHNHDMHALYLPSLTPCMRACMRSISLSSI